MITKRKDLFNQDSICIFTDSSFKKAKNAPSNSAIGTTAPAFCVIHEDCCIEQGFHILHNSTSQQGELYAMLLGVMTAYKYRSYPHIRLFSDNQNAVFSVREWIFKWAMETANGRQTLGPNGRINNQEYIMDIVYTIISNNIFLELYHVKGHVDIKSWESVKHSKVLFERSNPFVGKVDDALIYQLAMGNNMVDEYSTVMLRSHICDEEYNVTGMTPAVTIGYTPFDMHNYITLVNKDGKKREF